MQKKETEIITLCSSLRFNDQMKKEELRLTHEGFVVIPIEPIIFEIISDENKLDPRTREKLAWLHERKIDISDAIFVINVDGYIGESVRREIDYAEKRGKKVYYLE